MSFKLTQAVIDDVDAKLTLSEWAVLVVLSRYADDAGGNCFPSLDTLAQKSHACVDTVRAALKGLVKKGKISYTQEPGMKRQYTLTVPQGVGNFQGVGKVIGVGDFQGVQEVAGVGKVQPLPSENSNLPPRKSPTRKEQEKNDEENRAPAKKTPLNFYGLPESLIADWKVNRKKHPLTQTAIDGFKREAEKAHKTLEEAVRISVERGWQGFKAEWLLRDEKTGKPVENPFQASPFKVCRPAPMPKREPEFNGAAGDLLGGLL